MGPIGQKRLLLQLPSPHIQKSLQGTSCISEESSSWAAQDIENNKITCCCFFYWMISSVVDTYQVHPQYCTILQSKATYGPAAMNWIAYRIPVMPITRILKYLPATVSWAILLSSVLYHHFDAWIVGFDFNSQHHSHAFFFSCIPWPSRYSTPRDWTRGDKGLCWARGVTAAYTKIQVLFYWHHNPRIVAKFSHADETYMVGIGLDPKVSQIGFCCQQKSWCDDQLHKP